MGEIFAFDFDGTICKNLYPKIGDPLPKVVDFIKRQQESGNRVILWTCRTGNLLDDSVAWCRDQGIEFDAVNENLPDIVKQFGGDCRKIYADHYIDDRSMDLNSILNGEARTMPFKADREYRVLPAPLSVPATAEKRIDSDFYVEGYATTFNQPYVLGKMDGVEYREIIDAHALDGADMSDVIMQYDHQGKVLARQSNGTLIVQPDARGLFVAADLSKSNAAKDMYEEIQNGLVTKMSWAFIVDSDSYDSATHTRTILKISKVYDVSAVSIPANSSTDISARSYAEGRAEAEKQELLERRKKILKLKILLEA